MYSINDLDCGSPTTMGTILKPPTNYPNPLSATITSNADGEIISEVHSLTLPTIKTTGTVDGNNIDGGIPFAEHFLGTNMSSVQLEKRLSLQHEIENCPVMVTPTTINHVPTAPRTCTESQMLIQSTTCQMSPIVSLDTVANITPHQHHYNNSVFLNTIQQSNTNQLLNNNHQSQYYHQHQCSNDFLQNINSSTQNVDPILSSTAPTTFTQNNYSRVTISSLHSSNLSLHTTPSTVVLANYNHECNSIHEAEQKPKNLMHPHQQPNYETSILINQERRKSESSDQSQNENSELPQNTINEQKIKSEQEDGEPEPEIDIVINNVVCSFSVRCHLNLREIALNGVNVEFRRENGMVTMKLRRPYTTASIWSSGRITCTGATSEEQAKIAARRYARCLQKLGFNTRFNNFRVVNVLGTCIMPWAIRIVNFSERYKKEASYEPELHPGVIYKLKDPKATLKIFSTGSITVTAASVANVQAAIEHIFPLVYDFRKQISQFERDSRRQNIKNQLPGDKSIQQDEEIADDDGIEIHNSVENDDNCEENDNNDDYQMINGRNCKRKLAQKYANKTGKGIKKKPRKMNDVGTRAVIIFSSS